MDTANINTNLLKQGTSRVFLQFLGGFRQHLIYSPFANQGVIMHTLLQLRSGALQGATSLKLSEGLNVFPIEIFDLADMLEVLDLSGNMLRELPQDFGRLWKLRIFFCSDNLFTVLPEVLADCKQLDIVGFKANTITTVPAKSLNTNIRWLILTNNNIEVLPDEIGECARLQKLMLAGNKLRSLPDSLRNCRNLSLLRIAANRLTALPDWLLHMPRLSWLAFSGNEFSVTSSSDEAQVVDWSTINTTEVLGEGASGIIYKGVLANEQKEVAVKVFKGAVTSDGLPKDELQAFIAAGTHKGLVRILGQIAGHPNGRKGVVMELIDKTYYNLGLPPTFDTCTRDVFDNDMQLSARQVVRIAGTMASVARHLHSRGIMHGDFYAHNILIDSQGNALLGDFGAASVYDPTNTHLAFALERIEVSAFGCLLDDLLQLCPQEHHTNIAEQLSNLRDACMAEDVNSRPSFEYVCSIIDGLL